MSLVEQAVRTWEAQRATTISQVEDIPEEQLDFRPGDGARSVREIAAHLAEAQVGIVAEVVRPGGNFGRLFDPQVQAQLKATLPPARTKAELLELLRSTGEQSAARLREAGDALVTRTMQTLAGEESCLSGLWFGVGHEMYHSGQLALCARAVGRVPAMTQRINAMLAGAASAKAEVPPRSA